MIHQMKLSVVVVALGTFPTKIHVLWGLYRQSGLQALRWFSLSQGSVDCGFPNPGSRWLAEQGLKVEREELTWATIAVRRGSYKSLFLLNSGRFFP